MADGQGKEAVEVTTADPTASAVDFVPLDDSDSPVNGHDGDDSASDVPMTTETDDEDDVDTPSPQPQAAHLDPVVGAPYNVVFKPEEDLTRKRKSLNDVSNNDHGRNGFESVKKVKLAESMKQHQGDENFSSDWSRLPAEVWQHIFTFCPPRTLGRLLRVDRLFNMYLDPSSAIQGEQPPLLSRTAIPILRPNSIWQLSRRRFWPGMPSPLQDKTELYMWQLSCSSSCQHCGLSMSRQEDPVDPWQSGPGKDGVAIIWPFATRSCGLCLLSKSTKEIDILLSSSIPSTLTAALPPVFVTGELHAVSSATVERGQPPAVGQLTKLYWSAHVEDLRREFLSTKAMGTATVEEWLKGLDGRGAERRNDASRWEKWATVNDNLRQMSTVLYPGYQTPAISSHGGTTTSIGGSVSHAGRIPGIGITLDSSPAAASSVAYSQHDNNNTSDTVPHSSSGTVTHVSGRQERTKEEVAELKAVRKAEIERRAFALDPPLPAHILAHIPSFQAALQIITPMDDQGWELLKPRLLAQRAEAEQREKESVARAKQDLEEKRSANATKSDARDQSNAEDCGWDEAQAPVRARIAGYADEIIRDAWEEGEKVGRDNCAKFAVEALTYIRKRFYTEVAKDAAAARAAGKPPIVDPPQGPFTQKLTLENMKWIFDVKIKPLTERYRKEIFMCNGCEVTVRSYGFEGVIQHYAAKHTTALSIGNVVVHWRAEWPEYPPYTFESKSAKNLYQNQPAPSGYNAQQPSLSQPFQPPGGGPAPGYGPSPWAEPQPPGSLAPYSAAAGGYLPPQGYSATPYPAPAADSFHSYPPAQTQQPSYNGPAQPASGGVYNYNYGAYQSNGQAGYQPMQPSPFSAQYSVQLEDMAHMARDLWNSTANMKDTLSIVRVQVVVYHLAKRFHAKFHIPLPLSTFIDGLSNHKDMRPVRNVNGLVCRVCHQSIGGYVASEEERKSWSLPQLTAHFQAKHVEPFLRMGQYGQQPEWTVDMVLLPDPAAVSHLRAAISMDGHKYHLVNEAVPHLLEGPSVPQAAAERAPAWADGNSHYQNYQEVPVENPAPYYGQTQPNGPLQDGGANQYSATVGVAVQYPPEPPFSYGHPERLTSSTNPNPPTGAYAPTEPTPHSVALSRCDDNGNKSSQGHRQRFKKNKKKATNRDSIDEEARKRTEEEEKMAEEEAEREADVIRAMWAADRAVAASKSVVPEGQQLEKQVKPNKPANSKPYSKSNTPKQNHRFQSRPPRNSPRRDEAASPLSVRDSQVDPVASSQPDAAYRGHRLSNVAYVDEHRDETTRQNWQRSPNPYDRYGPPPSTIARPRSRSQEHEQYGRSPPASQYRQRTPRRRPADEPVYQPRPPVPVENIRYERDPPRDDYPSRGYGAPGPAPELIEYEIIEYRNPDGTIYIEERPLRRIPNSEAGRYYREAPPPMPAPYDRGEPLPPLPPSYRRDQPIVGAAVGEPYHPPYERAYSRAPQAQPPVQPPSQAGPDAYDPRYPFNAQPRRNDPPPPSRAEPAYYEEEEYDPRYPNGPSNVPVPPSRPSYR
ncbi:hypothetical protein N0V93_003508 [Gnomoniopsis smithogilvyi]|uniref:DUF7892 domain-containing protein n=1 Tax=Gnomoniopsis smithogilvyi TaxID=1191159 RepID=A0A9W8YYU2_9PEZI|nr:hypothetical protein N0V93_003508 [Gnomoniopsis smithogilvyi]